MTSMFTPTAAWEDWMDDDLGGLKQEVMPSLFERGSTDRVLLVTGENAGGKSLVSDILGIYAAQGAKDDGGRLEVMDIGMKRRTTSGIERGFIFGSEPDGESTGHVSVQVALSGLDNSAKRQGPHWLVLDEPDIGLGDGYHKALGKRLAAFAEELPALCHGFVVVTHSRAIAEPLLAMGASSLRIGPDLRPVRQWLAEGDLEKSIGDLTSLGAVTRENRRKITGLFRAIKEDNAKDVAEAPRARR